jgi:quercetin dioxygenase-like cupin family protein
MDVRAASPVPVPEHANTVTAYFMFNKDELHEASLGSHLEFINEFTIPADVRIEPHFHNSLEFYYVLEGKGWMQIGEEKQEVGPRDLIYIPPNAPHTMWSSVPGEGMRCFCFAASFEERGAAYTVTELSDLR